MELPFIGLMKNKDAEKKENHTHNPKHLLLVPEGNSLMHCIHHILLTYIFLQAAGVGAIHHGVTIYWSQEG